jgi:hypothetical protein
VPLDRLEAYLDRLPPARIRALYQRAFEPHILALKGLVVKDTN